MSPYKYLQIYQIDYGTFRGNNCAKVYFSGEGEHRKGWMATTKEIIDKVMALDEKYVVLTGGDPFHQSIKMVAGLCYMLKRRHYRKLIMETDGSKFNQLLFVNVKHFILHPNRATFKADRFKRWMDNASYKLVESKWATPDLSATHKSVRRQHTKFVELVFDIKCAEDMAFASQVFTSFPEIRQHEVKVYIRRQCDEREFALAWKEHRESFLPYSYLYIMD